MKPTFVSRVTYTHVTNQRKMSQFFTNEAVSLEKEINSTRNAPTKFQLIDETYELKRCIEWIQSNDFKKVCLQFPDHLLPDSSEVALRLQRSLRQTIYILADTAYESCCVDYVAAGHVNADAIIHFGEVCFSKSSAKIPYLNIYEKNSIDLEALAQSVSHTFQSGEENLIILLDTSFIHMTGIIEAKFNGKPQKTIDSNGPTLKNNRVVPFQDQNQEKGEFQSKCNEFRIKTIDSDDLNLENQQVIFIGGRNQHRKLPNLKFSHKPKALYYFKEEGPSLINYETDEKILRRRYFLIEKIKDSNTVGIVIGTLGVKNYLEAIERIKKLLKLHNKKYYIVSVGKPTVAKLANFPEIDIYVVITCALNEIYDSRDYYKPIVTLYDVEMALNPLSEDLSFSYDYNDVISRPIGDMASDSSDLSLLTGKIRGGSNISVGSELVAKEAGTVALNTSHGAGFLAARTWKGLERDLGRDEVKVAEEGRRGIAQHYSDEAK